MEVIEARVPQERLHPLCVPLSTRMHTKTGTWRYIKPIFKNRLAPCTSACPTGVNIRDYLRLVEQGELEKAWRLLKEDNPIPAVSGRVCYHPCEETCNRSYYDQPVAIHSLERLVGDFGLGLAIEKPKITEKEKVVIVGSGPAGLAAAYHLIRQGYSATVFEAESELGGMLRWGIPQYRLPRDILDKEISGIEAMGIEFKLNSRLGANISWTELSAYQAIFIATGCYQSQPLGIPGEDTADVASGLDFLREANTGRRSNTALAGQNVAIIGGGNVAVDAARCARRLKAKEVSILYRRSREEMPATTEELADAEEEGVKVNYLVSPLEIISKNGSVQGIRCVRNRLGKPDASGRPAPIPIEDSEFLVDANMVIAAIGQAADVAFLPKELTVGDGKLALERLGKIGDKVILAGGDVVTGPARVVDALAAGKRAAATIDALLKNKPLDLEEEPAGVSYEELNTTYFWPLPRQEVERLSTAQRLTGSQEINPGLSGEAAFKESQRCFHCGSCNLCGNCWLFCPDMSILERDGQLEIDYDFCKGCVICAEECPRAAIQTEEELE